MTFLSPWIALLAAAVALPLLLLLYFLKLRRRHLRVASTLLWEKSFQDLQANTPFQRIRWSILLLLQLLTLIVMLLALSEPLWPDNSAANAGRIVLLIDRSASMNARDGGPAGMTRLEAAKAAARELVNNLARSSRPTQVMVMAFGSSAQVVCGLESRRQILLDAINSIEPTDEESNLEAALQLAGAFTAGRDENPQQAPPEVVLVSDGNIGPPRESSTFHLRSGTFRMVPVGPEQPPPWESAVPGRSVDNLGIVAFSARRDYENPAAVEVFARLLNAGNQPIETVLTLTADDQAAAIARRTVPAATESGPGEETFQTSLDHSGGATLGLRHNHADALAADDAAWIVLPPPTRPRIAIVHPDDSPVDAYVKNLVSELEPLRLDEVTESSYESRDPGQIDAGAIWDLIVFDRVSAARLPGIPSLTFGAAPTGVGVVAPPENPRGGQHILSWDRQHPLMRNVSLDTVAFSGFTAFDFSSDAAANAIPLAFGPDGPVIALLQGRERGRSARHIITGFALAKSNWPLNVSIAVFMQNAVDFLIGGAGSVGVVHRPGEPITIRADAAASSMSIDGPIKATVPVSPPGSNVTLPTLRLVGLYALTGAAPPNERVAMSMLSDVESDIRTREEISVTTSAAARARAAQEGGRELWPWLIAAAFVLLVIEWLVYCARSK